MNQWIEFTQEYDEDYGMEIINCKCPDDEEEILVTDGKEVWLDTFINDGEIGCGLDNSNRVLVAEVTHWMSLPKPPNRKDVGERR